MSDQLHVSLVSLMPAGSEALQIVKNSVKEIGLDAWRRLCKIYDPNNPQTNRALLKRVLRPPRVVLENISSQIETWEQDFRLYKERTEEHLPDSMRRMCLEA
eukprot:8757903-Heterocapsa_arctica.AAC.1